MGTSGCRSIYKLCATMRHVTADVSYRLWVWKRPTTEFWVHVIGYLTKNKALNYKVRCDEPTFLDASHVAAHNINQVLPLSNAHSSDLCMR